MQQKIKSILYILSISLFASSYSYAAELGTYCWSGSGKDGLKVSTSLSASSSGEYFSVIGMFSYTFEGNSHSSTASGSGHMMNDTQAKLGLNLTGDAPEMTLLKNNGYNLMLNLNNLSGQLSFTTGKTDTLCNGDQYSSECTVTVPVTPTACN